MLSRAKSLEGFLISRPATRAELSARPPQYLLDEIARLERLEETSLHERFDYIMALPKPAPASIQQIFHKELECSVRFFSASFTFGCFLNIADKFLKPMVDTNALETITFARLHP